MAESSSSLEAQKLLRNFYCLQEERVQTYQLFEEGFKAYLRGAPNYNFPMYRQLVHEITQTFKKISEDVISIKKSLGSDDKTKIIATLMEKIQEEEETKLNLTASLQIARQDSNDNPLNESYKTLMTTHQKSLQETKDKINEYLDEMKYESEDLYSEEDGQER